MNDLTVKNNTLRAGSIYCPTIMLRLGPFYPIFNQLSEGCSLNILYALSQQGVRNSYPMSNIEVPDITLRGPGDPHSRSLRLVHALGPQGGF